MSGPSAKLTSFSHAVVLHWGYWALLGFPSEVCHEEVGKHLIVCNSPTGMYFWWALGPVQAKMKASDPFLLLYERVTELSVKCKTRCKGSSPETFSQLPSSSINSPLGSIFS